MTAANTRTGQCQRYHEYDNRPRNWHGERSSTVPAPRRGAALPPTSTATVPTTGTSAAVPGNSVLAENANTDQTIAANPHHVRVAATDGRRRDNCAAPNAINAPAMSSHARDGSEKNAHACDEEVQCHESQNDTTAIP